MRVLAECNLTTCPGMWEDGDEVVVRGTTADAATLERLGREVDEMIVRLPKAMVLEAAAKLG